MKAFFFGRRMRFVLMGLVILVVIFLLVKKSQRPPTLLTKPITLPQARLIPRKIVWHWVSGNTNTPKDSCEKSQRLLELLCTKAERSWACVSLFIEAKAGSVEKEHWRDTYMAILQKQCEQEDNPHACQDLLLEVKEDSVKAKHWRDKLTLAQQKQCEQKGNADTCLNLFREADTGSVKAKHWRDTYIALSKKQCEQGKLWFCRELSESGVYDTTQLYKKHTPLWRKQCEQENNVDVCEHLFEISKEGSSEKEHWDKSYEKAKKQNCLMSTGDCTASEFADFSAYEQFLVVKNWEARCQKNAEDCEKLSALYIVSCQQKKQFPPDQQKADIKQEENPSNHTSPAPKEASEPSGKEAFPAEQTSTSGYPDDKSTETSEKQETNEASDEEAEQMEERP